MNALLAFAGRCRAKVAQAAWVLACVAWASADALGQTQAAVEYRHAAWDYYFVTSGTDEIAALDGGAFNGVWKRTGESFPVWSEAVAGSAPACRFFSASFAPRSSHFFTPFASECASVGLNADWLYEGIAFHLQLPDLAGSCPAASSPLYRLYNDGKGGAPNHRYTTSPAIAHQMRSLGWISEGVGPAAVFACVPRGSAGVESAEGVWSGATDADQSIVGVILDDGTFYFLYSVPSRPGVVAGVLQGGSTSAQGRWLATNARDFSVTGFGVTNAALMGVYSARSSLSGKMTSAAGAVDYSARYQAIYEQPASLVAISGTYSGRASSKAASENAVVTVDAAGNLAGSTAGGCSFRATAVPRGSVNIFDVSVSFLGGPCVFGTATLFGIAYYDATIRTLYAVAPNALRSDLFVFTGER